MQLEYLCVLNFATKLCLLQADHEFICILNLATNFYFIFNIRNKTFRLLQLDKKTFFKVYINPFNFCYKTFSFLTLDINMLKLPFFKQHKTCHNCV